MSRYIDADALLEDVRKNSASYFADDFAREWVDRQPTADVRKNEHGEWHKPVGMMPPEYAGVYRCSKCDEIAMRDWKHHKQVLSNFCPNCGADMRGEEHG